MAVLVKEVSEQPASVGCVLESSAATFRRSLADVSQSFLEICRSSSDGVGSHGKLVRVGSSQRVCLVFNIAHFSGSSLRRASSPSSFDA